MSIITNKKTKQVFGALLGLRNEEKIEAFYCFEFLYVAEENDTKKFDLEFIENRKKLTDHLFKSKNYEMIGFYYTTGDPSKLNKADLFLNEFQTVIEKYGIIEPVYLIMGTDLDNKDELPLDFYISKNSNFEKISHKIEGDDAERITLDTVMKFSEKADKESVNKQILNGFKNALDVLRFNLNNILEVAERDQYKKDPKFQTLLADVVANFPSSNSYRMNQIMEDKNYENSIMNGLGSCTLNEVYVKNYELMNYLTSQKF